MSAENGTRDLSEGQLHRLRDIAGLAHDISAAALATALDGAPESLSLPLALRGIRTRLDELEHSHVPLATLFDPAAIRFGRFIGHEPPAREWLIEDVLPARVVGLLASMGGAGKSYLVYQLLVSVCTGLPFLGMRMPTAGSALYLASEDDEDELHRRGLTILDHYAHLTTWGPAHAEAVAERLHVVSRVAQDNLLTNANGDGEVKRTPMVQRLIEAANRIPDLRLIVLDPISRFRGGRANDEQDATRFAEAAEAVREATGAAVLGLAHVSQAGIKEGGGQEIVRGSTALVDAVRWVATLQRLTRDRAPQYGVHPGEADRYLRLEVPKSNYAPPFGHQWLRREVGGVLVPCELEENMPRGQKADSEYLDIVERIQALLREKGALSAYSIRERFCGRAGVLGAGDKTVRAVIERALRDGSLTNVQGKLQPPSAEDSE